VVNVLVIVPAVPETPDGVKKIGFGVWKLARFEPLRNKFEKLSQSANQE
jgi:hypothetical protein